MIARQEVINPDSTLNRCRPDEPVFVLCSRDKLAPLALRFWIQLAAAHGVSREKIAEAEGLARQMELWADAHGSKVPD